MRVGWSLPCTFMYTKLQNTEQEINRNKQKRKVMGFPKLSALKLLLNQNQSMLLLPIDLLPTD